MTMVLNAALGWTMWTTGNISDQSKVKSRKVVSGEAAKWKFELFGEDGSLLRI